MLVNGKWTAGWHPIQSKDVKGGFVRQESQFRNWITGDGGPGPTGEGGFPAEAGRYHLYVALTCPWASRTLLVRKLNNGVYRAGFASTQQAYEEACRDVFEMLDELERRLERRSFVLGERMTETDVRLFVTLVRFDAAYHGLFKCNLRRLIDYPNLAAYVRRVLAIPGAQETVNIDHIKHGYYSIKALNPTGIVPLGPEPPLAA